MVLSDTSDAAKEQHKKVIFLVEDDKHLAADIVKKLGLEGYQVQHFTKRDNLEKAFYTEKPNALIIDLIIDEKTNSGTELITKLKNNAETCPPVICTSELDDINIRLASVSLGARHHLIKPLNIEKLIQSLSSLTSQTATDPYRILVIDDDRTLLMYYSAVLRKAGMDVKTLDKPKEALPLLAEFKPDVIVIDIYMPECSGPELAQVIRQDSTWATTPIIFLSAESDISRQLIAMDVGGDDFLVKPVQKNHFVMAVTTRANRARWNKQLNNDLDSANRERKYQLVTVDQHNIVSMTDTAGRITYVNPKFCEISGYNQEELLGQNHRILNSGYHPASFFEDMWETISQGKIWHGITCNKAKDNTEYWVDSTIVPFLDSKGKPYKYVSARTDITKLRQNEERLTRSQQFANIGTWDWNITTDELVWSEGIGPLFGYHEDVPETNYDNFLKAVHPDDRQMVVDAVTNCIEHGADYDIEHRVLWPDGSIHWVSEHGNVMRSDDGKALHMLGVVQDINKRAIAEAKNQRNYLTQDVLASLLNFALEDITLKESLQKSIELIIESSVVSSKQAGSIFLVDETNEKLLMVAEQGLAKPLLSLCAELNFGCCLCGKAAEAKQKQFADCLDHRHEISFDGIEPHGHYCIPIMLQSRLLGVLNIYLEPGHKPSDEEHEFLDILVNTLAMVIVRKKSEQSMIDAREEAENANLAKSQFLASMSHELRTPMNAIMGFGQLLQMETDPALTQSQEENVNEIVKAGSHLLELINEVLDLAKIEAGRIELSIETVLLGEIITEALQLIMPLVQKNRIEVNLIINGNSIEFEQLLNQKDIVRADRTRLRQVLINLLSNAVKYNSANGKLTVAYQSTEDKTHISISDTGKGITEEQQKQLFSSFSRLDAEQTEIEGTGIGLVITKKIVEQMGGTIGVDSQLDKGSTFWFELPSDISLTEQQDTTDTTDTNKIATTVFNNMEREYSVLYIEDNPANLRLITQILEQISSINLSTAHEPILGLELATEHKPDLILLDINLPGMDGFEVLRHLSQNEATSNIPVVAISANASPKAIQKSMEAGFDDYITKPIDVNELLNAVTSKLGALHK